MNIIIQIPAFNEAESIGYVIEDIKKSMSSFPFPYEIVVIDDGSTDTTAQQVQKHGVTLLRLPLHQGLGCTFKKGLEYALAHNADCIINIDADSQYYAKDIPRLVKTLSSPLIAMVIGDRQILSLNPYPWHKRFAQIIGNLFISALFHFHCKDASSGLRIINRDAAALLVQKMNNPYTYTIESIGILRNEHKKILFIPVCIRSPLRTSRLITSLFHYITNYIFTAITYYAQRKSSAVFFSLLATLFSLFLNGYQFFKEPPLIFTLAKMQAFPHLYTNDLIQSCKIKSILIYALSIFAQWHCLEWAGFILYLVFSFLFFYIVFLCAKKISFSCFVPHLTILLLVFKKPVVGGIPTFLSYLSYSSLGTPLALLSLYCSFHQKYYQSLFTLSICFLIHPLSAIPVFLWIGICFFTQQEQRRQIVYSSILGCICIAPVIISKLFTLSCEHSPFFMTGEWVKGLKIRSAHHFFPFHTTYAFDALILFAFCIIIIILYAHRSSYQRSLAWFCMALTCLCSVNFFIISFFPISLVVQLQLYRSILYIIIFSLIFFANNCIAEYRTMHIFKKGIIIGISISLMLNLFWLLLPLLFCLLFCEYRERYQGLKQTSRLLACLVLLIFTGIFTYPYVFRNWGTMNIHCKTIDVPWEKPDSDWIDIQIWARAHTSPAALFITPPYWEGFRYYSERPILGNWKDGTLGIYDPFFLKSWTIRMQDLKCLSKTALFGNKTAPTESKKGFYSLTESDFIRLGRTYSASYLVIEKEKMLHLKYCYKNHTFVVYKLSQD